MKTHRLGAADLQRVITRMLQGVTVHGSVVEPVTVRESRFSTSSVLAPAAAHGHIGLNEFDAGVLTASTRPIAKRVEMMLDLKVDSVYSAGLTGYGARHLRPGARRSRRWTQGRSGQRALKRGD